MKKRFFGVLSSFCKLKHMINGALKFKKKLLQISFIFINDYKKMREHDFYFYFVYVFFFFKIHMYDGRGLWEVGGIKGQVP